MIINIFIFNYIQRNHRETRSGKMFFYLSFKAQSKQGGVWGWIKKERERDRDI